MLKELLKFGNLIKIMLLVFFITVGAMYFIAPPLPDHSFLTVILSIMVISVLAFLYLQKLSYGHVKWVSPAVLFLLGFVIVHFQMFFYLLFGLELRSHLFDFVWASASVINKSAALSCTGMLAFMQGYLFTRVKPGSSGPKDSPLIRFYSKKNNSVFLIILAWMAYLALFLYDGDYRGGSYPLTNNVSRFISMLFNTFLVASIVVRLLPLNSRESVVNLPTYLSTLGAPVLVLTVWHMLFSLYVGDRGPVIAYGIFAGGLFFFKYKNVKLYQFIVLILFGATFLTLIGKARRADQEKGVLSYLPVVAKDNSLSNRFESSVPLEQTVELALSVRCVNHVLDAVPKKYDYHLGFFQLKQILSVVPGGSSLFLMVTEKDEIHDGSSMFVSYLIQGRNIKYGDGTTVIADIYLDFGFAGVVIMLLLFGLFIRKGENALLNGTGSLFLWLAILLYFAYGVYTGRSTLLFQLERMVMAYVVIMINFSLIKIYFYYLHKGEHMIKEEQQDNDQSKNS